MVAMPPLARFPETMTDLVKPSCKNQVQACLYQSRDKCSVANHHLRTQSGLQEDRRGIISVQHLLVEASQSDLHISVRDQRVLLVLFIEPDFNTLLLFTPN